MYNPETCRRAQEAEQNHALSAIASDTIPWRHAHGGRLPLCPCPDCDPDAWPADIQDQLDEFAENNGPGTVAVDE